MCMINVGKRHRRVLSMVKQSNSGTLKKKKYSSAHLQKESKVYVVSAVAAPSAAPVPVSSSLLFPIEKKKKLQQKI